MAEPQPTPPAQPGLSPTLKQWIGFIIALVLGILASRYGITPQPTPPIPGVLVVSSQPATVQSCPCHSFAEAGATVEAKRTNPAIRALIHRLVKQRQSDARTEDIDAAIDALTSDRPFLDWIRSGELLELIKAILEIIRLVKQPM